MNILILSGCSGAGKSSFVHRMSAVDSVTVVSADNYFLRGGVYRFDPSMLGEAHATCMRGFIEAAKDASERDIDGTLIVDNTNTTIAEIAPYVAVGTAYGHDVTIVTFPVTDAELPAVAARNLHGVPPEAVRAMRDRAAATWAALPPWWDQRPASSY